jgi:hypothetical protein
MEEQVNIPARTEDRDKFKAVAAKQGKSMKDLFHEIVQALPEVKIDAE